MERLYEMARGARGRTILSGLRLRCLDERSGRFTSGGVAAIVCSGVKPVFRVWLADGLSISCTREHRFLTPSGWQSLETIVGGIVVDETGHAQIGRVGGLLLAAGRRPHDASGLARADVELGMRPEARRAASLRRSLGSVVGWEIDRAEERGSTGVMVLRSVVSAVREPARELSLAELRWLDTSHAVGDVVEELLLLGVGEEARPVPRAVVSVTHVGERETFDIEMEGPHHNFVANGVVTHNSQLSQRYVDESQACYVVPPAVIGSEALEVEWKGQIEEAQGTYVGLVDRLMERYGWVPDKVHRRKMAREAARSVLPNATEAKIVVTGNARAWRTMLELRTGEGAELEIRRFAVACLRLLQGEAPGFFSDFEIYQAPDRREAARVTYHKV